MANWVLARDGVFDEADEGELLDGSDSPMPPRDGDIGLEFTERQGFPGMAFMYRNKMYYIPGEDAAENRPQVRSWDGTTDAEFWRSPIDSLYVLSIELVNFNGMSYMLISTYDDDSPLTGRVYAVNMATQAVTVVGGGPLPTGFLPYGFNLFAGIIVMAGYANDASTEGKLFVTNPTAGQPGYNSWTEGYEVPAGAGGGFTGAGNGTVGIEGDDEFAQLAAIASINTTTGAITLHNPVSASGGSAASGNAFLSGAVFKGVSYVSFWNADTTPISKIYQVGWDSDTSTSTLTEVWAAGSDTDFQKPINQLYTPDNQLLYAAFGGTTGQLLVTSNGTAWTDVSTSLPDSCPGLSKAFVGKVRVTT